LKLKHCLPATALQDYSSQYEQARDKYLAAAKALKMATGPYQATRDAYVAAGVNAMFVSLSVPSDNVVVPNQPFVIIM
jgi:hypothetical protein